jgi:hypothetical protein
VNDRASAAEVTNPRARAELSIRTRARYAPRTVGA